MEVPNEVPEQQQAATTADDYLGYQPELFEADSVKEKAEAQGVSPQELINSTLKEIKVDDNGKFVYPDDMDPMLKAAVAATKSFRDTQASYTKSRQELKALQAELETLKQQLAKSETPTAGLSPEEQKQLEELKFTDPDAWYSKMKQLEQDAQKRVTEKLEQVTGEARQKTVEQLRKEALDEFNSEAENKLTMEQLQQEIPPIWLKQVEDGSMTFEDLLSKASDFIYGSKVVQQPPSVEPTTNLNQVAGGTKEVPQDGGINYATVTF
jgi:DNA repair exonuclease SbcCD ATPase subunit